MWKFLLVCLAAVGIWFYADVWNFLVQTVEWSWPTLKWVLIAGAILVTLMLMVAFSEFGMPRVKRHFYKQWQWWWNNL